MNLHNRHPFPATRWSLVAASQRDDEPRARAALADLCRDYWFPVFGFIRARSGSVEDAEDRTQGFFGSIIKKRTFARADPGRGKFRTFLLAAARHFLDDERDRDHAMKRGADRVVSFDAMQAEERLRAEPRDHRTPEQIFMRRYVTAMLDACLAELREEWAADGNAAFFDALAAYVTRSSFENETRDDIASRLGIPPSRVKDKLEDLKERLGKIIRRRVSDTLHHPTNDDIVAERDALLVCLTE